MSILLEYCQDIYVLTEAYHGKPKEFILIEKKLEKVIEMIRLTKEEPSNAIDINSMREVEEIEKLFTKFFKNKETSITFYTPIISPGYNAFTVPSSLSYFKKDKSNKRVTRSEDLFINVNVDIGLVYGLEMTPAELMSIILHEIGHCYDASMFMLLTNVNIDIVKGFKMDKDGSVSTIFNKGSEALAGSIKNTIMSFLMGSTPVAKFYQAANRFVSSNPIISKIWSDISNIILDVRMFINQIIPNTQLLRFLVSPAMIIASLLNPRNLFGYAGEKFADSFATSYGYGPDTATVFNKMRTRKGLFLNENVAKIPILNIGYDFYKVVMQAATFLSDPHPTEATRIQSQLNKLKKDLKDPNLSPKVRRELTENIEELETYIDDVLLNIENDSNKGRTISYFWNYMIIKVFNGKIDPRELFEAVWNHEM